jgi:hypothetical protein
MSLSIARALAGASLLWLLATPVQAQASGFVPGELIFQSQAIPNLPTTSSGIIRIDPTTGAASLLLDLWNAGGSPDSLAYDPYRERLIFYGSFPTFLDPERIYLLDGFGNTTSLGNDDANIQAFAPASAGRIYFKSTNNFHIQYFDAANTQHTLLDASGLQPFSAGTGTLDGLHFDAGTNALFVAVRRNSAWNCGAVNLNSQVLRLPLSPDGSRVLGGWDCTELVVDPTVGSAPNGLIHGPGGDLLVCVATGNSTSKPRMQRVDPISMQATPFAWNGGLGGTATNGGVWSSLLGRAVLYDSFAQVLRSYAQGDMGAGTVIPTSIPLGSGAQGLIFMVEIAPEGCGSLVGLYCTPKTTSSGCVPAITTAGSPSATAGVGFDITASQVGPGNVGIFFYSTSGPASQPFQGGLLCVGSPTTRTSPQNSGGAGACSGSYAIDFNAYIPTSNNAQLVPGAVVHGQFWFRDPPDPTSGSGLSGGVTFTLCP